MSMILDVGKSELGWELTFDGVFAPECEATVYPTKREARVACEKFAAECRAWNRRGLSDAPHMDAY